MATKWIRRTAWVSMTALALVSAGCGDVVRQGRSPVQLVINFLQAAPGAQPDELGATLLSDVITNGTIFNDVGQVTLSIMLKDPGQPGLPAAPSNINRVTIDRYRVEYKRADGRNTPGVDVPFPFDSAVTFTVPAEGTVTSGFEIVRVTAKLENPLFPLATNGNLIATIADVTFFGRDLAGNDIQTTGSIQVNFANFADPE